MYEGDIELGNFSERLLGALVREGIVPNQTEDEEETTANKFIVRSRTKTDLSLGEERLKAELIHIGLIPNEEPQPENEITSLLLKTQNELRDQIAINSSRKRKLLKIAEEYMGYQEYNCFLDDINKSVEQAYIKRFVLIINQKSNPKKLIKKKPDKTVKSLDSFTHILQNRQKLIQEVGDVYFHESKFLPATDSIYTNAEQE